MEGRDGRGRVLSEKRYAFVVSFETRSVVSVANEDVSVELVVVVVVLLSLLVVV